MRILNKQELYDIVYGAAIYGTGGGGSLAAGLALIDDALTDGKTFQLVTFDEMDSEDLIGTPYSCGAISPLSEVDKKKYAVCRTLRKSTTTWRWSRWRSIWAGR